MTKGEQSAKRLNKVLEAFIALTFTVAIIASGILN